MISQNDLLWNSGQTLQTDQKYKRLIPQLTGHQRQLSLNTQEQVQYSPSPKKYFKTLESACMDFGLILLEITTDMTCLGLVAMGQATELLFRTMSANMQQLIRITNRAQEKSKAKSKFNTNTCKQCVRNMEHVRLSIMLPKTTFAKEMRDLQKAGGEEEKSGQAASNSSGTSRQEFTQVLDQVLDDRFISLNRKPAQTEKVLKGFLDQFKIKSDVNQEGAQKEYVLNTLEQIRKEENIEQLEQMIVKLRNCLLGNMKQPLLNYADRMSHALLSQSRDEKQLRDTLDQETQTTQTSVSEIVSRYESKIVVLSSEINIRRTRTKELEKQLLSNLIASSNHSQVMRDAKTRISVFEESIIKISDQKQKAKVKAMQNETDKNQQIDIMIRAHKEQVRSLKKCVEQARLQSDNLRQEQYRFVNRQAKETETIGCQTLLFDSFQQFAQSSQEKRKRLSHLKHTTRMSTGQIQFNYSRPRSSVKGDLQQEFPINLQSLTSKVRHTLLHGQNGDTKETNTQTNQQPLQGHPLGKTRSLQITNVMSLKIRAGTVVVQTRIAQTGLKEILQMNSPIKRAGKTPHHRPSMSETLPKSQKTKHPLTPAVCPILEQNVQRRTQRPHNMEQKRQLATMELNPNRPLRHKVATRTQNSHLQSLNISIQEKENPSKKQQGESTQSMVRVARESPAKFRRLDPKSIEESRQEDTIKQIRSLKSNNKHLSKNRLVHKVNLLDKHLSPNPNSNSNPNSNPSSVNSRGRRVNILEKIDQVRSVIQEQFQFLNKIGFIDILTKLSNRTSLNRIQKRPLNLFLSLPTTPSKSDSTVIVFTVKDFSFFGGYESALKYQTGRGLWSPQLHTQNFVSDVNPIVAFIESLRSQQSLEQVINFIVSPVQLVVGHQRDHRIRISHVRVALNIIFNYHRSFCTNCTHIQTFLKKIGYLTQ